MMYLITNLLFKTFFNLFNLKKFKKRYSNLIYGLETVLLMRSHQLQDSKVLVSYFRVGF